MERALRYGVLGAGRMAGATMLELMAGHAAATPVAWYEIDPGRADTAERIALLRERGIDGCSSLDELLGRGDVDVILNVTPHFAHAETTIAALEAGHTVVCEKPPACSIEECEAMKSAAERCGRQLLIHFQHLLRPGARWLNRAICAGALGRIRRVKCLSLWWRSPDYYRRVDWAGKRSYQGRPTLDGVLVNQSIHHLNQMLAFGQRTGESEIAEVESVRAAAYRFHPADALEMDDTVVAAGRLANSDETEFLFAATTCAADCAGPNRLAEYFGIADSHLIEVEGDLGRAVWDNGARLEIEGRPAEVFEQADGPWPFYFHVRDVLAGREAAVTPIEQAVKTMRCIFSIYGAAGNEISARAWERHEEVSPVLRACCEQWRLPGELDTRPDWA